MRTLITMLLLLFCISLKAQITLENAKIDTLHLNEFKSKKVLYYKLGSVTFLVDYKVFMKMYTDFWKQQKAGQKFIAIAKKKHEYYNPDSEPMWKVLDSVYKLLRTTAKKHDTLYLSHSVFSSVGYGTWGNFFPDLIEKNKCAIFNNKGERQYNIIRETGGWYKGHLAAWAGRRYFLFGYKTSFIEATDMIS